MAARLINRATAGDRKVTAAIVQRDDGVLIHNRLTCKIPIVDEVALIDKVPIGMRSAVEVAAVGGVVEVLSNPYGIATLFGLSSDETRQVVPIARALIGNRSAVVIKTPAGDVKERKIPAGTIELLGENRSVKVDVDDGADKIMKAVESIPSLEDVRGEPGTNAGDMLEKITPGHGEDLTSQHPEDIKIQDLLAVETHSHPRRFRAAWPTSFPRRTPWASPPWSNDTPPDGPSPENLPSRSASVEVGGVEENRHGHPRRPHSQAPASPWPFWTWARFVRRLHRNAEDRSTPSTRSQATWSIPDPVRRWDCPTLTRRRM